MTTGETQLLQATDRALTAARRLSHENPEWTGKALRIYLSGKGCSGFEYGASFDARDAADESLQLGDVEFVVDPDTAKYMRGSTIDWVDDERGKGFLVENPNHKKFRGKFFKRDGWQEKLIRS